MVAIQSLLFHSRGLMSGFYCSLFGYSRGAFAARKVASLLVSGSRYDYEILDFYPSAFFVESIGWDHPKQVKIFSPSGCSVRSLSRGSSPIRLLLNPFLSSEYFMMIYPQLRGCLIPYADASGSGIQSVSTEGLSFDRVAEHRLPGAVYSPIFHLKQNLLGIPDTE